MEGLSSIFLVINQTCSQQRRTVTLIQVVSKEPTIVSSVRYFEILSVFWVFSFSLVISISSNSHGIDKSAVWAETTANHDEHDWVHDMKNITKFNLWHPIYFSHVPTEMIPKHRAWGTTRCGPKIKQIKVYRLRLSKSKIVACLGLRFGGAFLSHFIVDITVISSIGLSVRVLKSCRGHFPRVNNHHHNSNNKSTFSFFV